MMFLIYKHLQIYLFFSNRHCQVPVFFTFPSIIWGFIRLSLDFPSVGGQSCFLLRLNWEDKAQAEAVGGIVWSVAVLARHTAEPGFVEPTATTEDAARADIPSYPRKITPAPILFLNNIFYFYILSSTKRLKVQLNLILTLITEYQSGIEYK